MIILSSSSDELRISTGSAGDVMVHASWVDASVTAGVTTTVPDRTNTEITTAATTPVVGSPAGSPATQRGISTLIVRNVSATVANTVSVIHWDGSTAVTLFTANLLSDESLQFVDGSGFSAFDVLGNRKTSQALAASGTDTMVQFNDGLALGADAGLTFDKTTGTLSIAGAGSTLDIGVGGLGSSPTPPSAGVLRVFGRTIAGRAMLAQIGPSGLDTAMQPFLGRNKVGYWCPPGNATTAPGVFGIAALTAQGTATSRTVATTSLATRMRRLGYPSSATAGTFAGARLAVAQFSPGSGSPDGTGLFVVERWVESDPAVVAGRRAFHGLTATTGAFTNVEVDTLLNLVGVIQLSTDATQWYRHNAGSVAQTGLAVPLGTSLGAPGGNSTTAWELAIFAPNGVANTYYCQMTNITTGATAFWTVTGAAAVCPQSTTLLAYNIWATNNATALAVGIDICSLYIETDT